MVIDAHAHFFPRPFLDHLQRNGGARARVEPGADGVYQLFFENRRFARFTPAFHDVGVRLGAMDSAGVDTHVLSLAPPMVFWAGPDEAVDLCRLTNDALAAMVRDHPGRFLAAAAVPLQDPRSAAREARRAVEELGHRMILVGTNIAGMQLDDPLLEPFYAEAERLGTPLFVHPISPAGVECMRHYRLDIAVGFPLDTTLAAARVALSGLLDRHPGLKFCWSHLGGGLPFLADRIAYTVEHFPGAQAPACEPFPLYMHRFWYDSVVYSERDLEFGLRFAGPERVVFGTDAPFFGDSTRFLLDLIRASAMLSAAEKDRILSGNAVELLGLDAPSGAGGGER